MSPTASPPAVPAVAEAGPERLAALQRVFRQAFFRLNPRLEAPRIDVAFRRYASLRSVVRFDPESGRLCVYLSDLLAVAPRRVIDSLATILLSRLYDKRVLAGTKREYDSWVNSSETQDRMIAVRRVRGRKRMRPPQGLVRDLEIEFDALNRRYFGGGLRKPALGWSVGRARKRLGHYDPAHDVIVISSALDAADVPALALEYVLYHEMLHVKHPTRLEAGRRCIHTPEFLADERRFPEIDAARRLLVSLN